MTGIILGITLIMLLCVLAEKFSDRLGMPALILFMFIGMLFGSDGIFKVPFENFELAERICIYYVLWRIQYQVGGGEEYCRKGRYPVYSRCFHYGRNYGFALQCSFKVFF